MMKIRQLFLASFIIGLVFLSLTVSAVETSTSIGNFDQSASILTLDTDSRIQYVDHLKANGYSDKEIAGTIVTAIKAQTSKKVKNLPEMPRPLLTDQEIQDTIKSLDLIKVDENIKNSTDYWILLVAEDKQKEKIVQEIEIVISDKETKQKIIKNLTKIWENHLIEQRTKDYKRYITFTSKNKADFLNKTENETLAIVDLIHEEYYNQIYGDATPKWAGNPGHWNFMYWAFYNSVGFQNPYRTTTNATYAADHAPLPDDQVLFPHLPSDHYYNPNVGIGWAPDHAGEYARVAGDNYQISNYDNTGAFLGYASHFVTDVGNPFHTGREIEQGLHPWVHTEYEGYVAQYWNADFNSYVQGNQYQWKFSSSPEQSTRDVAIYSNQFLDNLYYQVYYHRYTLPTNTYVRETTRICILEASKYTNGLVDWILLSKLPGQTNYPTDPDDDKFLEDLNANGRLDFDDVILYYIYESWIATTEPYVLFDYNQDVLIDYDDVVALFEEI